MSFRKNLEYLRKSKKLSQEELANKLNISRQSVSKWESGAAYPETEKILAICKIFDCTLDELMNQNIQEEHLEEKRTYTFNDFLESVTDIVDRSIRMITSMNGKSLIRFLFELGILFLLILLLKVPFDYIYSKGANIFLQGNHDVLRILLAFWSLLIDIVYLVVAAISFAYIYKVRFLDMFDDGVKEDIYNRQKVVKKEFPVEEGKEIKSKREKVQVRHDFGVFSFFGKIALFFVKCLIAFCSLFVIFFFLGSVAGLVVVSSWFLQGIFYFSILLLLLALIVFLGMLIIVLYNFIFNRKTAWKKVLIVLLGTIISFGLSAGLGFLEFKEFTIYNDYRSNIVIDLLVEEFPMSEGLIVEPAYGINYVEDSNLTDKVRVEVAYSKNFVEAEIRSFVSEEGEESINVFIHSSGNSISIKGLYNIFLNNLREKEISADYGYLFDGRITVYSSMENIEKIRSNSMPHYDIGMAEPENICTYDNDGYSEECNCATEMDE
ncbi:MAG: helix-turn-helix transcriptional regulator [Candidatus Dojkabacteria bacterium]